MDRLGHSLERGPARWLATYVVLGALGGVLGALLKHAFFQSRPDLLWHASRAVVPWLLIGLSIGSTHWDLRAHRYGSWLASTVKASAAARASRSPGRADPEVVKLSPRRRAGCWLALVPLIVWFAAPIYADRLHDQIQRSIFAGRTAEAVGDARQLFLATWVCPFDSARAVSDAHIALGLGCLERNDVPEASEHLLEAARTSTLPTLTPVGVGQYLARGLLERGQEGAVVAFLETCRIEDQRANRDLDHWIAQVRRGERPEFGPALIH